MKTHKTTKRNNEMKNTITKCFNNIKKTRGASLAEFAVVAAMMGTMATVAAPKFSGVGAGAEKQKTSSNMDLIAQAASNFYNMTATEEKKGRFPGQDKYTNPVGTYGAAGASLAEIQAAKDAIEADIKLFDSYTSAKGAGFVSVFGLAHVDAPILPANVGAHTIAADDAGTYVGATEWMQSFGGQTIASPFQDGHYIYAVVPGMGVEAPTLYIADLVNPAEYNTSLKP
jgi:type II secretory pathway pseudopilin PulG